MRLIKRLSLLLCLLFLLAPVEVPAEDSLEISITYGVDGKVQLGKGYPATVTVKNNGETISGDLVFFTNPNYETAGNMVVPVEFPKGEETTLQVSIPGLNENYHYGTQNNKQQLVKFYEEGWESGKEVSLKGNTTKRPTFFQENRVVIGVLTENPDELNVLKTVRYNNDSIELLNLTKENLPSDATALEIFDVMVINNYQVSTLNDQQAQAIQDWVRAGGHIMLGSDPLLEQHEALHRLFLMEIEKQTSFEQFKLFWNLR
ncbi:hypothetical protein [Ornithinibacillus scapharcae]|uniref:hypothetical protein n=1 Tax=Ornithinibacillus scapharcae TaxID=1147159 RepID=UPI000306AE32|nr:hypothetical protein [Ornithinibacillus scapharcae]